MASLGYCCEWILTLRHLQAWVGVLMAILNECRAERHKGREMPEGRRIQEIAVRG